MVVCNANNVFVKPRGNVIKLHLDMKDKLIRFRWLKVKGLYDLKKHFT